MEHFGCDGIFSLMQMCSKADNVRDKGRQQCRDLEIALQAKSACPVSCGLGFGLLHGAVVVSSCRNYELMLEDRGWQNVRVKALAPASAERALHLLKQGR